MAVRIATEYVNAVWTLPEAEMPRLIQFCRAQQLRHQVCVLDNGNQEVVLADEAGGESLQLTFERSDRMYRCSLTCRVVHPHLTDTLRKMVSVFKGDAVVNRIYRGFTMVYHYMRGSVVRIAECKDGIVRTVYEWRDPLGRLEAQFKNCSVEEEIFKLKQSVNELLDRRNQTWDENEKLEIDERLKYHSRMLFMLEA